MLIQVCREYINTLKYIPAALRCIGAAFGLQPVPTRFDSSSLLLPYPSTLDSLYTHSPTHPLVKDSVWRPLQNGAAMRALASVHEIKHDRIGQIGGLRYAITVHHSGLCPVPSVIHPLKTLHLD